MVYAAVAPYIEEQLLKYAIEVEGLKRIAKSVAKSVTELVGQITAKDEE